MENDPVSNRQQVKSGIQPPVSKGRLSYYKALPALTSFAASFPTLSDPFIKPLQRHLALEPKQALTNCPYAPFLETFLRLNLG